MERPYTYGLHVSDLAVERGSRIVAAGVSFNLSPGEALTLRGANGTGKTSILRAVAGFSSPAEGRIFFSVDGGEADPIETRAMQLHWLGGDDAIADRLTLTENLSFWAKLLGQDAPPADLPRRLRLEGKEHAPLGQMSTGQRRRAGIGRLLCARRALWLLDEPMSGLDDQGRELMISLIEEHRNAGGIVLMASHDEGIINAPILRLNPAEVAS